MRPIPYHSARFSSCILAALIAHSASAAGLYWSANSATQGGAGNWDTSSSRWSPSPSGPYQSNWNNANNETAVFGGDTGGSVTLGTGITLGGLRFETAGYTLSGNTLTFGSAGGITANQAATVSSKLAGSVAITKAGSGTLTLNSAVVNDFNGGLNVNGGTLLADFANLATPTDFINSGNTLGLGGGILSIKGKSSGTTNQTLGNVTVNAGGGQILGNKNGGTALNITLGSLTATGSGGSLVVGAGGTSGNSPVITTSTNKDASGSYGGRTVFFNGTANTGYDWATSVSASSPYTLSASSTYTTLPTSGGSSTTHYKMTAATTLAGNLSVNTLKLEAPGGNLDLAANALSIDGGGILATGTTARSITGSSGNLLTAGNGSGTYDLIVHQFNSGGMTIGAVIGNNGGNPVNLVKAGTGTLSLSGANTYSGNTYANAGILDFAAISLSGFGGGAGRNIHVAAGASVKRNTLDNAFLNRLVQTTDEITVMTGTGNSSFDLSGNNGGTYLPNAFLGNWAGNGAKCEYSGTITPAENAYRFGSPTSNGLLGIRSILVDVGGTPRGLIIGGSRVELVAANTFTGDTVIRSSARLTIGNNLALQNSALDVGSAGGNFSLAAGTNGGRITGESAAAIPTFGGLKGSRNLLSVFTNSGGNNETNLASASVTGFTLNPGTGKTFTYSGIIADFAPGTTLTKTGAGTQVLTGAATYTGPTTVSSGILQIGDGNSTGSLATSSVTNDSTLVYDRSDNFSVGYGISGSGQLVKQGAGTLTLAAAPTYSGDTTVTAGTLKLNNPNPNNDPSAVTIAATGATLELNFAGTDTIANLFIGATPMSNGVYKAIGNPAPGTAIAQITGTGTLTVSGDLTPPAVVSFVDNRSGGLVAANAPVIYTVTFNEDMAGGTVSAAHFSNSGSASIAIGTIVETAPGIFTVNVVATSAGTLRLQIPAGTTMTDVTGNPLDNTAAIRSDTTLTVYQPDSTSPELRGISPTADNSGSTLTIDMPSGVLAGDLLIANIAQNGNNSGNPTAPGWTLVSGKALGGSSSRYGAVLYKVATTSEAAAQLFTLTGTSPSAAGVIMAFSSVDTSGGPFDATLGTIYTAAAAASAVGPATQITTVSPNAVVLMLGMAVSTNSATWSGWSTSTSPGALAESYDRQGSGTGNAATSLGAAWAVKQTPGATGTGTATLSSSTRNGSILLALKPSYSDSLLAALNALKSHVTGETPLTDSQIAVHKATIVAQKSRFGSSVSAMVAAFDLVRTYDEVLGALWVARTLPDRANVTDDLHYTIYTVMQIIMDWTYTSTNLTNQPDVLAGFQFGSSANFPGPCPQPADPNQIHTATIHGNYLNSWGRPTFHEDSAHPAPKPTGTYLAPGSIATVTVPPSLVGRGYRVRVGANSWDYTGKPFIKRLDRVSRVYEIVSTDTQVANPLGGGIYVEVPQYVSDVGVVSVQIKNAVRSPYFSAKSFHRTTLDEWRNTERHHAAPWADFQSEKVMMQVPTSWIYALDDPVKLMADWDLAADICNDLMGFPRDRGRETIYNQVDVLIRAGAYAPGYPAVNNTYTPGGNYNGYANSYLVRGPQFAPDYEFHEHGHAYLFPKFPGEVESVVNLLHVPVWNQGFGYSLDEAFRKSRSGSTAYVTLDTTAISWMMCDNFLNGIAMTSVEKQYQLKGHAKFVDIARMFGWDKLHDHYYSFNVDYENSVSIPTDVDSLLRRLSGNVGVDIRPLFHFWGVPPINNNTLGAAIASANLPASAAIYDALVHYKSLIPADNATFRTFAFDWWTRQPLLTGFTEENNHARRWDTYDAAASTATANRAQQIIDLYFPNGRPATDYETWAAVYSPSDLSDPQADFDGDGLTNDEERAFGLHPTSGASVNPIAVPLDVASGTLTYTRRNPALTGLGFHYEWSETLAAGGWTTFTPASEIASGASPVETVAITLDSGLLAKPALFVRIVAQPD